MPKTQSILDGAALALVIVPYLALTSERVVRWLSDPGVYIGWMRGLAAKRLHGVGYAVLLLIPFLLVSFPRAATSGEFLRDLGIVSAWQLIPAIAQMFRRPGGRRGGPMDWLTIAAILIPIELKWLPDPVAWNLMPRLLGVLNGFLIFLTVSPIQPRADGTGGAGYTFRIRWQDVKIALIGLAWFTVTALPLGFSIGFMKFGVFHTPLLLPLIAVGIYLSVGMYEEMLYRAVVLNIFERWFPRAPIFTLVLSAAVFGIAHVNNVTKGNPVPNWSFVLMAFIAGLAYGWVWRKTGKISAAGITHAGVNTVWIALLNG